MNEPLMTSACWQPATDTLLNEILRRGGAYHHYGALFYRELWQQRLASIGFRVRTVERLPCHPVWDLRLRGGLAA